MSFNFKDTNKWTTQHFDSTPHPVFDPNFWGSGSSSNTSVPKPNPNPIPPVPNNMEDLIKRNRELEEEKKRLENTLANHHKIILEIAEGKR